MIIGKQASNQRLQLTNIHPLKKGGYVPPFFRRAKRNSQEGFTIIESLIAILVAGVLLAAIAPVITLAVATRVQSRRVELATQAARAYIDAVRTQKIVAPVTTGSNSIQGYAAPTATGTLTCTANNYCTAPTGTSLYCIDFDNSGSCETTSLTDMIVQAFRPNNTSTTTGYSLGIRIYRANAFGLSTTLLNNTPKQATFTGGLGQSKVPLVEMTTDINDIVPKYGDLCTRISGGCS